MKKTMMLTLFVFVLVLAISLIAYAGATKVEFIPTPPAYAEADGGIHADAEGFVILNKTPKGATEFVIQIQLWDAATEHEYAVYSGGFFLGTFTTNKRGNGGVHCNLTDDERFSGTGWFINIWRRVKVESDTWNNSRLLKARIP